MAGRRLPAASLKAIVSTWLRPLILGSAAALVLSAVAGAQTLPERIQQCGGCHGEDGNSRIENIPSLAGQPDFFVLNQLFLMREGVRRIEPMMPFVKNLTDDDLNGLAQHFSKLEPKASGEAIDPSLARRGSELAVRLRCASCHLPSMAGQQQMPRLAKQRIDYLVHSLKEFRDNKRSGADTLMSAVVAGLPDTDLTALAHFTASR
jgi:cytochrome c553